MASRDFKALTVDKVGDAIQAEIRTLASTDLPEGDTIVEVDWSSLNYKDAMVLKGMGGLVRTYPHVPGIDLAGRVIETGNPNRRVGEEVILTGWRVGETRFGGYGRLARVPGEWLTPLPHGLDLRTAMALGTAGLTAMLCIDALERQGLAKDQGPVLVTGAGGGVGSVAVLLLASLGYEVAAVTGRESLSEYLRELGAHQILPRGAFAPDGKPLERERWAGVVDTVGGDQLARVLAQIKYGGSVACCGLAGGAAAKLSVVPFLLRGVNILGIDSVMQPADARVRTWTRLAKILPREKMRSVIQEAKLSDVQRLATDLLAGQVQGRVVVQVN